MSSEPDVQTRPGWRASFQQWLQTPLPVLPQLCLQHRDAETGAIAVSRAIAGLGNTTVALVVADSYAADALQRQVQVFLEQCADPRQALILPEISSGQRRQWISENEAGRCAALEAAMQQKCGVFVCSVAALLAPTVEPHAFTDDSFVLRKGDTGIDPTALAKRLIELDYDNEYEVHAPGEFARRGGIVDVYTPVLSAPVRIDFFADEIDSMRMFDPETQKSFADVAEVKIVPRGIKAVYPESSSATALFLQYLPAETPLIVCQTEAIRTHLQRYGDADDQQQWQQILGEHRRIIYVEPCAPDESCEPDAAANLPALPAAATLTLDVVSLRDMVAASISELGEDGRLWHWQQLRSHIQRWHAQDLQVVACCGSSGEAERFGENVEQDEIMRQLPLTIEPLPLEQALLLPTPGIVLLSERELFGRRPQGRQRTGNRYRIDMALHDEIELEQGCYAVHASHGICLFHGVTVIDVGGTMQEVMDLEFADAAHLYVPLEQSQLISRYIGGNKKLPRLNKLGGSAWRNTREAAANSAYDLAAELLRTAAVRKQAKGHKFREDPNWERLFAESFAFRETADQTQAIADVLADLQRDQPMDRLLCGDVGYGKTEVAMRAAFRAAINGKQVAVLVPTTILAQQHYLSFCERMADYPITIEMLSRFRSASEQRQILSNLASGGIDIVIGTHRLLSSDIHFTELGLVIIDEEQRFGVVAKEKFKHLRAMVDVLTMTATPIPRTLYFSLSGLRNLSTIMTPPAERLPVTTIVAQYDLQLIRQAIMRELERRGQVFFLHNRVESIEKRCAKLAQLVPEARFAVGHGQMHAHELEDVMAGFLRGETDVLVCTTIIESGLDIANANTIIIDRADRFGLAELYQLRGRVGRYHHQAYAYLLLPPMGSLAENARQRLAAIRRYTQLGAGFKLALRDLEIRGAGNILGKEQSGQIAAVGFELYLQLLRQSVQRLEQQQPRQAAAEVPVMLDTVVQGQSRADSGKLAAAIPASYIDAEPIRIAIYRRCTRLGSAAEVDAFAAELRDRFGALPAEVETLLALARIRTAAAAAGIGAVAVRQQTVYLETARGLRRGPDGKLPRLHNHAPQQQLNELLTLLQSWRQ